LKKLEVGKCLDEIEAAFSILEDKEISKKTRSTLNAWILKQKQHLKELKYKGKTPRKRRNTK
jgi:hypothetical protein